MSNEEKWLPIKDYEGLYEVSTNGRIKVLTSKWRKEKVMVLKECKRGYFEVCLTKNKVGKSYRVHRIVAQTFIPNYNNKTQVNHINGIKTDNNTTNLEWVSQSENIKHAFSNCLISPHGCTKISLSEVSKIKRMHSVDRIPIYKIGLMYGVSAMTISRIISNKTKFCNDKKNIA